MINQRDYLPTAAEPEPTSKADAVPPGASTAHDALVRLTRLLARAAAKEAFIASGASDGEQP